MSEAPAKRTSPPLWVTIARVLGLPVLSLWAAVLLIASWPEPEDLGSFRPLHEASRDLIHTLKTRSASYVFAGRRGKWKRKFHCIMAVGSKADGTRQTLYQTHPNCVHPKIRVFEDTFNVNLKGLSGTKYMKKFVGAGKQKRKRLVKELRRQRRQSQVAQFFCESEHFAQPGIERVDLLWQIEQIHYDTQKVHRQLHHVHRYDCRKRRRITQGKWFELEMNRELGPQILSEPEPAKKWRKRKPKKGRKKSAKKHGNKKNKKPPTGPVEPAGSGSAKEAQ